MISVFIASPYLGVTLETKALNLGRGQLKRQRQLAFKQFARLLVDLDLLPPCQVSAVGFGIDSSGAPGVVISYEPIRVEGKVAP